MGTLSVPLLPPEFGILDLLFLCAYMIYSLL